MNDTVRVGENDSGQEIALRIGQILEIRLPENPTTGFRWRHGSRGEPACVLDGDSFEPMEGPPGTGGANRWLFRAERVGVSAIELFYERKWEQERKAARIFRLRVSVREVLGA
jgi:inhibitor of cysteine peptidase